MLKLTDGTGKVLAFNDDHEDIASGLNTHHADSYLMAKLPADGVYYVHIGDTARHGGEEYAYRLRISARSKNVGYPGVYVIRKDGFNAPIKLTLKDPPAGITSPPVTLGPTQAMTNLTVRTTLTATEQSFPLVIEGRAMVDKKEIVREAMPAEDRMQAFLWRHLIPAQDLQAIVFDPAFQPPLKRVPPMPPSEPVTVAAAPAAQAIAAPTAAAAPAAPATAPPKPKFTAQQVVQRLRELKRMYAAGYLTDEFYLVKLAECQVTQ